MNPTQYRPDIDGLRAIAVLSVLFHHLNAQIVPGGFVGVDIFFVISGFLITSQIYKEINQQTFSISQFYKRRINRIIPALAMVTAFTLFIGIFLLSPADLLILSKSALASIFGVSNIFFWREYGNYFTANSAEAPLLHTWSLGVEEQFYLIWPILLVFIVKASDRYAILVLTLLLAAAFFVSEAGTRIAISASYYLLPTRFFELMIGGVLALVSLYFKPTTKLQANFSFLVGMLLIFGTLFFINKESSFPGINAMWPSLGSALIIWSGHRPCSLHRILTNKPIVFIGLISFSLYLWHWPLIAFLNYLEIPIDVFYGSAVFAMALVLASSSWKYVETPFRQSGASRPISEVFVLRLAFPASAVLAVYAAVAFTNGFPQRFDSKVASLESNLEGRPNEIRAGCHVPTSLYSTPPSDECRIGAPNTRIDGILIGDSFANHFTGMLDVIAKRGGISLMDYTMDGCPPILNYNNGKIDIYAERCIKRNQIAYSKISANNYAQVVLAANWPKDETILASLTGSIEKILATGAKVTIILSNQHIKNASSCSIREIMYHAQKNCDGLQESNPDYLEKIRSMYPNVEFIDPNLVICRDGRCRPVIANTLLYLDDAHLNELGSRLIGEKLLGTSFRWPSAN